MHAYRVARPVIGDRKATDDDDTPRRLKSTRPSGKCRRPPLSSFMIAIGGLLALTQYQRVASSTTNDHHQRQTDQKALLDQLRPASVDTKYWSRGLEFGERDNWRNRLRPCTLLERIALDDDGAIISLGDAVDNSFGALESASIRELLLAKNGALLLEVDTLQSEEAYIVYLNETGDCFDSSTLPDHLQDSHWFRFEPPSDEQSWFNARNWMSELNEEIAELVPHSHQIPCSEDVVVFGSRRFSWGLIEANERSSVIPFKVNFRPSELKLATYESSPSKRLTGSYEALRVSKLMIGDKSYTQDELDQLIERYGNNLFDFADGKSIFNLSIDDKDQAKNSFDLNGGSRRTLIIDESSIQATDQDQTADPCQDEAGCLCGNEQAKVMDILCSFNQPLNIDEMLCLDPIKSHGYCDPICATTITINMLPARFSERYVLDLLQKLMLGEIGDALPSVEYFSDHIFVAARRVDHAKYEITFRVLPVDDALYHTIIGRDAELARLAQSQLEKAAIKSFYGIKTVNIKSSNLWRRNNRSSMFWSVLIMTMLISILVYDQYDSYVTTIMSQFGGSVHSNRNILLREDVETVPMDTKRFKGQVDDIGVGGCDSEISRQEFALDVDAQSITDSTCGLLTD